MKPDRGEAMRQARRADSEQRAALVLAATETALGRGARPSIAAIARAAGVGRKFIYDHPDLKAGIELKLAEARRHQIDDLRFKAAVSAASLRADLENARAENTRLNRQLRALESRLSQAEGARLVHDDLLPAAMVAELADRQVAARNAELERQLFEAKEQLRRCTEELAAARTINRELMQQANRSGPSQASIGAAPTRRRRSPTSGAG